MHSRSFPDILAAYIASSAERTSNSALLAHLRKQAYPDARRVAQQVPSMTTGSRATLMMLFAHAASKAARPADCSRVDTIRTTSAGELCAATLSLSRRGPWILGAPKLPASIALLDLAEPLPTTLRLCPMSPWVPHRQLRNSSSRNSLDAISNNTRARSVQLHSRSLTPRPASGPANPVS